MAFNLFHITWLAVLFFVVLFIILRRAGQNALFGRMQLQPVTATTTTTIITPGSLPVHMTPSRNHHQLQYQPQLQYYQQGYVAPISPPPPPGSGTYLYQRVQPPYQYPPLQQQQQHQQPQYQQQQSYSQMQPTSVPSPPAPPSNYADINSPPPMYSVASEIHPSINLAPPVEYATAIPDPGPTTATVAVAAAATSSSSSPNPYTPMGPASSGQGSEEGKRATDQIHANVNTPRSPQGPI